MPCERSSRMRARELVVVGDDHPALADREVLVGEEAEAPDRTERPARLARPAALRPRAQRPRSRRRRAALRSRRTAHSHGKAAVVEHHDRLRPWRDRSLDVVRVEIEVVRPEDVAEDRRRAGVANRVRHRDEGQRGEITSSPGPTPAARSARCSAAVPLLTAIACRAPVNAGEPILELRHPGPGAPPPGADRVRRGLASSVVSDDVGERHDPAAEESHDPRNLISPGHARRSASPP